MSAITPLPDVDPVTLESLQELAAAPAGQRVSVYVPTHRSGPETTHDPVRLRNLLDRAGAIGADESLLAPMKELLEERSFWQHQADSLALFSGPGCFMTFRLPAEAGEQVDVSETFRVRPLVPLISDHDAFRILALSQNAVRLYQADRYSISELDLDGVPTSLAEALAYEDPERQLQVRSAGGDGMMFHGHGGGEEQDKGELERFFRAVDHGLRERFGVTGIPLVLASVGYYQPIYASVSTAHTNVLDDVAEGNPERRSAAELHADSWEIANRHHSANRAAWGRFKDAIASGLTATDLATVALAAAHGRVDTLFVAPGPPILGSVDIDTSSVRVAGSDEVSADFRIDLVDSAVLQTIAHSGSVVGVDTTDLPDGSHAAALLRY